MLEDERHFITHLKYQIVKQFCSWNLCAQCHSLLVTYFWRCFSLEYFNQFWWVSLMQISLPLLVKFTSNTSILIVRPDTSYINTTRNLHENLTQPLLVFLGCHKKYCGAYLHPFQMQTPDLLFVGCTRCLTIYIPIPAAQFQLPLPPTTKKRQSN